MSGAAVFLDRDGTLVQPRHYPSRPEDLIIYDGVAPALRQLQDAGFQLVVVTNQAGLARGLFTALDLDIMNDYLKRKFACQGVVIDAIYHCPHHVDGTVPELSVRCSCRKPQPGMLLQAADDLALDLGQSWFIGDILDDVEAGNRAGCRTVLVDLGTESRPVTPLRWPDHVARDTVHALAIVRAVELNDVDVELDYRPARWAGAVESKSG